MTDFNLHSNSTAFVLAAEESLFYDDEENNERSEDQISMYDESGNVIRHRDEYIPQGQHGLVNVYNVSLPNSPAVTPKRERNIKAKGSIYFKNPVNSSVDVILRDADLDLSAVTLERELKKPKGKGFFKSKRDRSKTNKKKTISKGLLRKRLIISSVSFLIIFIIALIVGIVVGVTNKSSSEKTEATSEEQPILPTQSQLTLLTVNSSQHDISLSVTNSNDLKLISGMMSLNEIDGTIDAGEIFMGTQKKGCMGLFMNGVKCRGSLMASSVPDPNGHHNKVLEISFQSDSSGMANGVQFYTDVAHDLKADEATLEYYIRFDKNFDFSLGGKLPGLHGGNMECSGGRASNGENCWNTRLMFRNWNQLETSFYGPIEKQSESFCRKCGKADLTAPGWTLESSCSDVLQGSHCSLGLSDYRISKDKWIKIHQTVKLNTPGKTDGFYELKLNGQSYSKITNMVYRTTKNLSVNGLFFSVFQGNGLQNSNTGKNAKIFFKGVKIFARNSS
eukprot:Awhi_evm1s15828